MRDYDAEPPNPVPDFDTLRTIKEYRTETANEKGKKHLPFGVYGEVVDAVYLAERGGMPLSYALWVKLRTILDWLAETSDVIPWARDPRFPDLVHGYRDS